MCSYHNPLEHRYLLNGKDLGHMGQQLYEKQKHINLCLKESLKTVLVFALFDMLQIHLPKQRNICAHELVCKRERENV